jgi:hypothetical protein
LYDETYEFYDKEMKELKQRAKDLEICYVSPVGGIPAMNTALLFQAIHHLEDRCCPLYVSPDGQVTPLDIGRQVLTARLKRLVQGRLRVRDFAQAAILLEQLDGDPRAIALARYAQHRLYFDFEQARNALDPALQQARREERRFYQRLCANLDGLEERRQEALIRELYFNARVTYRNRRYVDFLGRMFRFLEAVLRHVVETWFSLPTDASSKRDQRLFREGIVKNTRLENFLRERADYKGEPLSLPRHDLINIPVTLGMVHYLADQEGNQDADGNAILDREEQKRFAALHQAARRLTTLSNLRNRSIIAHGFDGVSEEVILREYDSAGQGTSTPFDDLRQIAENLSIEMGEDPFDTVADRIEALLEEV